jgi:hypothetical protein
VLQEGGRLIVMTAVPPTDVQWEHLDEAWRIFDTDADGLVTAGDLRLLLLTYGFEHSEAELASYLKDLPISLEADGALDKAQFMLWITKLHEKLMVEDREEKIKQEDALQEILDSSTLPSDQAARVRAKLAEVSPHAALLMLCTLPRYSLYRAGSEFHFHERNKHEGMTSGIETGAWLPSLSSNRQYLITSAVNAAASRGAGGARIHHRRRTSSVG